MSSLISVALRLLAGLSLGTFFYGGLWFTVRALPWSNHPVALALGSFWARTALVLAGFVLVAARSWLDAAVCLAGFVLVRILMSRVIPVRNPSRKTSR
jgi:F1F0 ATPase subunit 2